jgi:hypothetical protein
MIASVADHAMRQSKPQLVTVLRSAASVHRKCRTVHKPSTVGADFGLAWDGSTH